MTRNTRCSLYTAHTTSLLVDTKDLFLTFRAVEWLSWFENAASFTVFAQVLLLAVTITPIEDNILAATFTAAIGMSFGNH